MPSSEQHEIDTHGDLNRRYPRPSTLTADNARDRVAAGNSVPNEASAGGCTQFVPGCSRMTIDPRIPSMPGRSTSGFHQPGRHCLHQARSTVRCSASRMKGERHPCKNKLRQGGHVSCLVNQRPGTARARQPTFLLQDLSFKFRDIFTAM